MPKVEKIRGLNLSGTPRATSACRGIPLLYFKCSEYDVNCDNVQNCKRVSTFEKEVTSPFTGRRRSVAHNAIIDRIIVEKYVEKCEQVSCHGLISSTAPTFN